MKLNAIQSDGSTLRDHLEIVASRTGIIPEELEDCQLPDSGAYLWSWFSEVSGARGMGAPAISHLEIEAWARMKGLELTMFEVKAIRALDNVFMTYQAKKDV